MVLSIITVPGNLLIAIAIIKDPDRNLRSPFNFFVINLVMADLIIGIVTEPAFVVYHVLEAKRGRQLNAHLMFVHVTYFCSLTTSLLSIAALAVDRCNAITCSYIREANAGGNIRTSLAIWFVSLSVPWLIYLTQFFLFAFVYVNTAILMSVVMILVSFLRVRRDLKEKILEWTSIREDAAILRAIKRERVLTNSFLVMLVSFCLCMTPAFVMAYVINFCDTCSCDVIHWLRDLHFIFPLVNSAVNQFLYPWRMRNFRKAISSILRFNAVDLEFTISGTSADLNPLPSERTDLGTRDISGPDQRRGTPILLSVTRLT
ncbi:predicted protein [Nematostella vectensis]|uniref:G-protein coupled receptors family 1 profile domain-containing protein n=1 Tax=Nematostella vectensis TaxID=45351 RepID=A7SMS3_NEMVE|nr:predicted protein [Nematostella vectensis]|eukprot:XP_001627089.1 predicted protein [Nematostella vectensis]